MYGSYENDQVRLINQARAQNGKASVLHTECLNTVAENWAIVMASQSYFDTVKGTWTVGHNPSLASNVTNNCGSAWTIISENVGNEPGYPNDVATSSQIEFDAYMASAGHKANILSSSNQFVGVAAYRTYKSSNGVSGHVWYTVHVFSAGNINSTPATVPVDPAAPFNGSGSLGKTVGYTETFARGLDNKLYRNYYYNNVWSGWKALDGTITTSPSWVSWGPDRVDVFARGTDGKLYHKYANRTGWSGWMSLGGSLTSAPAVTSWSSGVLHVFARGTDNAIWYRSCGTEAICNGTNWGPWTSIGGIATSSPTAASMAPNNLNVFVTGTDQKTYNKHWTGTQWGSWHAITVPHKVQANTAPAAVSMGVNSVNVFVQGTDDSLYNMWWDGYRWNGPQHLGGTLAGRLNAVTWGGSRIDLYVRGTDGAGYHKFWDGKNWYGSYESLGGQIHSGTDLY